LFFITNFCLSLVAQNETNFGQEGAKGGPFSEVVLLNVNVLPKFGSGPKSTNHLLFEQSFVKMCDTNFYNRKEASLFFAERGWEYLAENELDTAMYRFNLSYLLDSTNASALWGMGVLSYQAKQYQQACTLLHEGAKLDTLNANIMLDLAKVELKRYEQDLKPETLQVCLLHLDKALDLDSGNTETWQKRALVEYYLGEYENAWECFHSARLISNTDVDTNLAEKISKKMKDPKGIYDY
jgi:tetratricopeptide (TPR) repeat protein